MQFVAEAWFWLIQIWQRIAIVFLGDPVAYATSPEAKASGEDSYSLSSRFRILPMPDRGKESTNSTLRGTL